MRSVVVGLVGLCCGVVLAGCGPASDPPDRAPEPTSTSTSYFASEEDALAAAEDAYRSYERELDLTLSGQGEVGLTTVATGEALRAAQDVVASLLSKDQSQFGLSVVRAVGISTASPSFDTIQIYGCLDVSGVDIVDSGSMSVVETRSVAVFPMIVDLILVKSESRYQVSNEDVWTGGNFCE